jgi:hypothetical protein
MAELLIGRLLVLLDPGKDDRGTVFMSNLGDWRGLQKPYPPTPNGEEPASKEYYDHVIFIKSMSETITHGGVDYQAMTTDAILGVIP